uniref:Uncharacterized protein n=1 Tax=Zea mays TaxID=4577 RepID=B4FM68_MAIZE|nr:unknown [Zea mays]
MEAAAVGDGAPAGRSHQGACRRPPPSSSTTCRTASASTSPARPSNGSSTPPPPPSRSSRSSTRPPSPPFPRRAARMPPAMISSSSRGASPRAAARRRRARGPSSRSRAPTAVGAPPRRTGWSPWPAPRRRPRPSPSCSPGWRRPAPLAPANIGSRGISSPTSPPAPAPTASALRTTGKARTGCRRRRTPFLAPPPPSLAMRLRSAWCRHSLSTSPSPSRCLTSRSVRTLRRRPRLAPGTTASVFPCPRVSWVPIGGPFSPIRSRTSQAIITSSSRGWTARSCLATPTPRRRCIPHPRTS